MLITFMDGLCLNIYLPVVSDCLQIKKSIKQTSKYKEDNEKGVILEVNLEYPQELHDLHNDYHLAPEKRKVTKEILSPYCESIREKFNISIGQVHKLIPTLNNKEKYVLHFRNVQLYTDLGLKVKKVHRVLEFDQSPWLRKYIDFNIQERTQAKNSFKKTSSKYMNNSIFGKTMENLRKRVDVKLVTDEKKTGQINIETKICD